MGRNNADFRNQVLFHGTSAALKPGDTVLPGDKVGADYGGTPMDEAWVTENLEDASDYGPRVYQVQHIEPPTSDVPQEFLDMNAGNNVYSSKVGFKVIKQVK